MEHVALCLDLFTQRATRKTLWYNTRNQARAGKDLWVSATEELARIAVEVNVCTLCKLHHGTIKAVPGEGPADAKIMFIGEAPGFNEDRQGRPFVGAAGKFLEELLALAGLRRG